MPPLITRREAAEQLRISLRSLDSLLKYKAIKWRRITKSKYGSVRIAQEDLDAYVESCVSK